MKNCVWESGVQVSGVAPLLGSSGLFGVFGSKDD
jgi:hypothetical protein